MLQSAGRGGYQQGNVPDADASEIRMQALYIVRVGRTGAKPLSQGAGHLLH